jgi:acyl-CoA thioester hydrolase
MAHRLEVRVYYEDTDLAGVVYYANYLRFIERGRTEALRALGIEQGRLRAERGLVFVVRRLEIDYLAPARFDDLLAVETEVTELRGARMLMEQRVCRGGALLARASVTVACMDAAGKAARLPGDIRDALDRLARSR